MYTQKNVIKNIIYLVPLFFERDQKSKLKFRDKTLKK